MPAGSRVMPSKHCGDARSASVFGMLAQIRSFLTVVEEVSLHRVAARLRISQPALSSQMYVRIWTGGSRHTAKGTGSFARNFTAQRKALLTAWSWPQTKMLFFSCRATPSIILRLASSFYPWRTRSCKSKRDRCVEAFVFLSGLCLFLIAIAA